MPSRGRPRLSVIICTYDMAREAPRTIRSAAAPYQGGVDADEYEVIVVDNGSPERLVDTLGEHPAPNVRIVDMPTPKPSPVFAMNWVAREVATGDLLLFAIDGARLFSDRLYEQTLAAQAVSADPLVYTLSWHLGPKIQTESIAEGYDQAVEDEMLAEHGWPDRAASLFEMSALAGSSRFGFFRPPPESNGFTVTRAAFDRLGGYDERFTSPGGGLCNLEMFSRHATAPGAEPVCLLGEGTFHQVHGGVATSGRREWGDFDREHEAIFGTTFEMPSFDPLYFGTLRPEVLPFLSESVAVVRGGDQPEAVGQVGVRRPPDRPPRRGRWASRLARFRPRR
jgi:hypothetical protein